MTESEPTGDEPIKTIESRRIDPDNGRVIFPRGVYPVGIVLDVVINNPDDAVAIMDAEVTSAGPRECAINIPTRSSTSTTLNPASTPTWRSWR